MTRVKPAHVGQGEYMERRPGEDREGGFRCLVRPLEVEDQSYRTVMAVTAGWLTGCLDCTCMPHW